MDSERALAPEERAAILAEWDRLRAEPRPAPPPYGCATLLVTTALFLLVYQLPRLTDWLSPLLRTIMLWISRYPLVVSRSDMKEPSWNSD